MNKNDGMTKSEGNGRTLTPLFDNVLVRRDAWKGITSGGIALPESSKDKLSRGTVLAVGPGRVTENGTLIPPTVRAGMKITFGSYSGTEIDELDENLVVMKEAEILAVVGNL